MVDFHAILAKERAMSKEKSNSTGIMDVYKNACQLNEMFQDQRGPESVIYFHPEGPTVETDPSNNRPRGFVFRENAAERSYWNFVPEHDLCIEPGCQETTQKLLMIFKRFMACKRLNNEALDEQELEA